MLNVGKHISISYLTPLLFIVCFFVGKLNILAVTYLTMLFHELSHTVAAIAIGLRVDKIILHPFGVNLRLKNKFVHSLFDEIILYMSGPLFNILFALVALIGYGISRDYILQYLYFMNIALFACNMLPILPLDGGVILKKVLSYFFGSKTAQSVMRVISILMLCSVVIFCIYSAAVCEFNISIIIIAVFLLGSILHGEEKYDVDFVRALMFSNKKENKRIKHILISKEADIKDIVSRFSNNNYSIVYITEENGKISDIITEREIIDRLA